MRVRLPFTVLFAEQWTELSFGYQLAVYMRKIDLN